MNQHSKKGGQANKNRVEDLRRGATRPAAVVAIVLCVGFAVAAVVIWPFRKPPSDQEMQTQAKAPVQTEMQTEPEAAVQTEIQTPEPVQTEVSTPEAIQSELSTPEAVQSEIATPEPVSPVSVPQAAVSPESSTAAPVSQANPAAPQLMDDQVNSPTPVQEEGTFSHDLNAETITFEAINPGSRIPGRMTVTVSGRYRGKWLYDGQTPAGSHLQADQQASFSFVPYDRYSPSYSATVRTLQLAGDTTNDSISFNFGLETTGSDGSSQRFVLKEVVIVNEDSAQVTFEQLL